MNPLQVIVGILAVLWLMGIAVMLLYSVISILKLKQRLQSAELIYANIFMSNNLKTPFVMGIINPRIYIPTGLSEEEKNYIIKHEQTHMQRWDHLVKPLAFLVLCVHWFNPLVWLAFMLMVTDMELSCDERVLRDMGSEIKKGYSTSLLSLARKRRIINASPLAFGESNIKGRIKNVLHYQKPAVWVTMLSLIAVAVLGVGLVTNPKTAPDRDDSHRPASMVPARTSETPDFYIMTDEVGAIGCEYGTARSSEAVTTAEMLAELEKLQGFVFDKATAEELYVEFQFRKKEPRFLSLTCLADGVKEYPLEHNGYRIKVPTEVGDYAVFAGLLRENGEEEIVFFSIKVRENQEEQLSAETQRKMAIMKELQLSPIFNPACYGAINPHRVGGPLEIHCVDEEAVKETVKSLGISDEIKYIPCKYSRKELNEIYHEMAKLPLFNDNAKSIRLYLREESPRVHVFIGPESGIELEKKVLDYCEDHPRSDAIAVGIT